MAEGLEITLPDDIVDQAEDVLKKAKAAERMLATAESCTGGLLAALLTDVQGYSHVFDRGFVSYSDTAKCDLLGIERELVESCGAVSREVSEAMAGGALRRSKGDVVVAITGFAGPAGENDEEGLVHFATACRNGVRSHREEHFGSIGRDGVRFASLKVALTMLDAGLDGEK